MVWFATADGALALDELPGAPAIATYFATLAFALLVACQAGRKLLTGNATHAVSAFGYGLAVACIAGVAVSAYLLPPDGAMRTRAPDLMLAGIALGIIALFDAARVPAAVPRSSTRRDTTEPGAIPLDDGAWPPVPEAPLFPGQPESALHALHGKLKFATASAQITKAGIDARREDGSTRLVRWDEILEVIARRLPASAPFDGAPFVDLVSHAHATLRILPWTRITGVLLDGEGGDRAQAFVHRVLERCPSVHLDASTRKFASGGDAPAQLPDSAMLAAHDKRLAQGRAPT